MRMIVPSLKERRMVNRLLVAFFREHKLPTSTARSPKSVASIG